MAVPHASARLPSCELLDGKEESPTSLVVPGNKKTRFVRPMKYLGRYSCMQYYLYAHFIRFPTGLFLFLRFGGQPYRLSNP